MQVDVYSRQQFDGLSPESDKIAVSIIRPGAKEPEDLIGWKDHILLQFDDVANVRETDWGLVMFSDEQAQELFAFLLKHKHEDFVVHCDAGISRSVAVGVVISTQFEHKLILHAIDTDQFANAAVMSKLRRIVWKQE